MSRHFFYKSEFANDLEDPWRQNNLTLRLDGFIGQQNLANIPIVVLNYALNDEIIFLTPVASPTATNPAINPRPASLIIDGRFGRK